MPAGDPKERLRAGELLYGCFLRYPDPGLTELLALQGFDFLVLDGEHGTMEPRDCENMVRGADVRGVPTLVRVPVNEPPVILRFMDTGALGVHVPLVSSADDADRLRRARETTLVGWARAASRLRSRARLRRQKTRAPASRSQRGVRAPKSPRNHRGADARSCFASRRER